MAHRGGGIKPFKTYLHEFGYVNAFGNQSTRTPDKESGYTHAK